MQDKNQLAAFLAYREGETWVSWICAWLMQCGDQTYCLSDTVGLVLS